MLTLKLLKSLISPSNFLENSLEFLNIIMQYANKDNFTSSFSIYAFILIFWPLDWKNPAIFLILGKISWSFFHCLLEFLSVCFFLFLFLVDIDYSFGKFLSISSWLSFIRNDLNFLKYLCFLGWDYLFFYLLKFWLPSVDFWMLSQCCIHEIKLHIVMIYYPNNILLDSCC